MGKESFLTMSLVEVKKLPQFHRVEKRLHKNEKQDLDTAVRAILDNPSIGESKTGDLKSGELRVYKFKMMGQECRLAYTHKDSTLLLEKVGPRQNFYRDFKRTR